MARTSATLAVKKVFISCSKSSHLSVTCCNVEHLNKESECCLNANIVGVAVLQDYFCCGIGTFRCATAACAVGDATVLDANVGPP